MESPENEPKRPGATLLVAFAGWNDAGQAATTAVQYVADQVEAPQTAMIDGEAFLDFTVQRPLVKLDAEGLRQILWPGWEIRVAEGRGLVFLSGPEPSVRWRSFSHAVVEKARELGVTNVGLLGSFLAQIVYSDPVPINGFASDQALLDRLRVSGAAYEGPTGIVGVLADAFRREDVPVLSLWAAVPHYIAAASNPRAALAILQKLREWIDLPIDLGPIEAAATTFQARLLEAVEGDSNLASYVRGMKKDEPSH